MSDDYTFGLSSNGIIIFLGDIGSFGGKMGIWVEYFCENLVNEEGLINSIVKKDNRRFKALNVLIFF